MTCLPWNHRWRDVIRKLPARTEYVHEWFFGLFIGFEKPEGFYVVGKRCTSCGKFNKAGVETRVETVGRKRVTKTMRDEAEDQKNRYLSAMANNMQTSANRWGGLGLNDCNCGHNHSTWGQNNGR